MPYITYLQLRTNMKEIQRIENLKITQGINDHAYLYLTAILSDQYKDDSVKKVNEQEQIEVFVDGDQSKTLFKGMIQDIKVKFVNGVYYLEVNGVSNSYLTDIKKQCCSFQDKSMKYEDMIQKIIGRYANGSIIDAASKGKPIDNFIMQYIETDWEFLKRMASHFNMGLLPVITLDGTKIVFGTLEGKEVGEIDDFNYSVTKNISQYMKSSQNTNPGLGELDAIEFKIETENDYQIGDKVIYQNIPLYIKSKEIVMEKGTVNFTYAISTKEGLGQDRLYNDKIVGLSLKGQVLEVVGDKIKVCLEIDKEQDPGKAWEFPYTTMYTAEGNSGWYCMPEKDDTVLIYFPTREENTALGMNSVRMMNKASDKTGNPDIKYFRTKDGKELMFSPSEIVITCVNGKDKETGETKSVYIRLNQETGIEIVSTEPISLKSDKGIKLDAQEAIKILSEDQIRLKCKTSEIRIDSKIDICGEDVKIN